MGVIGKGAFKYCGLTSVVIPKNVYIVDAYAFNHCSQLTTVDIQSEKDKCLVMNGAFYECPNIEEVTFGNNVEFFRDVFDSKKIPQETIRMIEKNRSSETTTDVGESMEKNIDIEPKRIDEEDGDRPDIHLDDQTISDSEIGIVAYNMQVSEEDGTDEKPYTPKNYPDKAVDVVFGLKNGDTVEIFLDTDGVEWDSRVNGTEKLTPLQMQEFFRTAFCKKMCSRLFELWPESDPFFSKLLSGVREKKVNYLPVEPVAEGGEFRKGNIDKSRSRGKNAAGEQIYTNSGRKIVSFSDFGIKHTEDEGFYCFPEIGKEFKWSQWADWKKNSLCARCRFTHNDYTYGLSLTMFEEDDDNRGFRSYNLDLNPKLQYCTPIETNEMLSNLTLVNRFLRKCLQILNKYMEMPSEEIFRKVGKPDKCTLEDIKKTKKVIRNTMKAIREKRADTFIYTD